MVEVSSLFIKTTIKKNSAVDQRVFSLIVYSMEVIPRENLISFGVMFKQNKLIKKIVENLRDKIERKKTNKRSNFFLTN